MVLKKLDFCEFAYSQLLHMHITASTGPPSLSLTVNKLRQVDFTHAYNIFITLNRDLKCY